MSNQRVMMLAPFGLRPKGTTVARIVPLARRLAQRGWQIKVLAPPFDCPEDSGRIENFDGAEVQHLCWGRLNVLRWTARMVAETRRYRPAVVHLFKPKGCGGLALPVLHALGQRGVVVDLDDREGTGGWNDVLPYPRYAKWLFRHQEQSLPLRAAAVTVASRALETIAWAQGLAPDRVFYLPNAIDRVNCRANPARESGDETAAACRFLIYSRFHEFALDRLLDALADGFASGRIVLDLAGQIDASQSARLSSLVAAGRVHVHGWVDRARLEAIASRCQAAIVPCEDSLVNRCRCSAKLFDLMGLGLPIVAHAVGEVTSLTRHGVDGLLVPPGDYDALGRQVQALAADPESQRALRANLASELTHHLWDSRVSVCVAAYERAQRR